jgi:hypothetical protein
MLLPGAYDPPPFRPTTANSSFVYFVVKQNSLRIERKIVSAGHILHSPLRIRTNTEDKG